jgi:hypothetical protein
VKFHGESEFSVRLWPSAIFSADFRLFSWFFGHWQKYFLGVKFFVEFAFSVRFWLLARFSAIFVDFRRFQRFFMHNRCLHFTCVNSTKMGNLKFFVELIKILLWKLAVGGGLCVPDKIWSGFELETDFQMKFSAQKSKCSFWGKICRSKN